VYSMWILRRGVDPALEHAGGAIRRPRTDYRFV